MIIISLDNDSSKTKIKLIIGGDPGWSSYSILALYNHIRDMKRNVSLSSHLLGPATTGNFLFGV